MRFKIDENLSESTKRIIIESGHDCHSVHDEGIGGGSDNQLIKICREERRHLITLDLDFADIIRYPPDEFAGIVILRLSRQDPAFVNQRLKEALVAIESLELEGHLVVVSDSRLRFR